MAIVLQFMKEYIGFGVTLGPSVVGTTCSKGVTFAKDCPWDIFSLLTSWESPIRIGATTWATFSM